MGNAMCDFTVPCLWGVMHQDTCGLCIQYGSPQCPRPTAIRSAALLMHTGHLWCSRRCEAKKRWEFQFHAQVIPSQSTCKNCAFFNFRVNHEIKQISLPVPSLFWLCCCCFFLKPRRSGTLFPIFLLQSLWDPIPKVSGLHLDGTISQLPW